MMAVKNSLLTQRVDSAGFSYDDQTWTDSDGDNFEFTTIRLTKVASHEKMGRNKTTEVGVKVGLIAQCSAAIGH
jgi:hypothetical protein